MKESRKTKYTRNVIHEALYNLLKQKGLKDITVKEITQLADINRSTFYAHYETLDELIKEIEIENANKLIKTMEETQYKEKDYIIKTINSFIDTLLDDEEIAFWFLDKEVSGIGRKFVYDYAENKFVPLWSENKNLSIVIAKYSFQFIYDGCIGILTRWYNDQDKISRKDLIHVFTKHVENTLKLLH